MYDDYNNEEENLEVKDCNGTLLERGDTVILTQDLKVKGSSINLKRGKVVKNIRFTDEEDEIEFKEGKTIMVLKTCYLKKQVDKKKKKK